MEDAGGRRKVAACERQNVVVSFSYTSLMSLGFSKRLDRGRRYLLNFADTLDLQTALSFRAQWSLALLLFFLLPTRRLSLFVHPNFYAEDAQVWFSQAYSGGWLHSLTLPDSGYLSTLQRLLTGFALIVPFHLAPLVDAIVGLIVQILPVPILLSERCRNWSPLSVRCIFAGLYALFPNGSEIHVVLTNSQWYFALALVLLAFAEQPKTLFGKVADIAFFLLAGICGPFGILLIPVMLLRLSMRLNTWAVVQVVCLAGGSLVQAIVMLQGSSRYHAFLGATLERFLHILGGEVFIASMIGGHHQLIYLPAIATLIASVFGFAVIVYCFCFAPIPLRLFMTFAGVMLAVSLRVPLIGGPKPLWVLLIEDPICRYWFIPGLSFLWGCAWCARLAPSYFMRKSGQAVLLLTCLGVLISWPYKNFTDDHFPAHAREFEVAMPGTHIRIPIYPDKGRYVDLVKH